MGADDCPARYYEKRETSIGLFIAFVLPKNEDSIKQKKIQSGEMRECPACKSLVPFDATKCKYCASDLPEIEIDKSKYSDKKCEKCGELLKVGYAICDNCEHINL